MFFKKKVNFYTRLLVSAIHKKKKFIESLVSSGEDFSGDIIVNTFIEVAYEDIIANLRTIALDWQKSSLRYNTSPVLTQQMLSDVFTSSIAVGEHPAGKKKWFLKMFAPNILGDDDADLADNDYTTKVRIKEKPPIFGLLSSDDAMHGTKHAECNCGDIALINPDYSGDSIKYGTRCALVVPNVLSQLHSCFESHAEINVHIGKNIQIDIATTNELPKHDIDKCLKLLMSASGGVEPLIANSDNGCGLRVTLPTLKVGEMSCIIRLSAETQNSRQFTFVHTNPLVNYPAITISASARKQFIAGVIVRWISGADKKAEHILRTDKLVSRTNEDCECDDYVHEALLRVIEKYPQRIDQRLAEKKPLHVIGFLQGFVLWYIQSFRQMYVEYDNVYISSTYHDEANVFKGREISDNDMRLAVIADYDTPAANESYWVNDSIGSRDEMLRYQSYYNRKAIETKKGCFC